MLHAASSRFENPLHQFFLMIALLFTYLLHRLLIAVYILICAISNKCLGRVPKNVVGSFSKVESTCDQDTKANKRAFSVIQNRFRDRNFLATFWDAKSKGSTSTIVRMLHSGLNILETKVHFREVLLFASRSPRRLNMFLKVEWWPKNYHTVHCTFFPNINT